MKSNSTRRQFLGTALLAAGSGPLILSRGARAVTADQRIGLGIIGYGIRSRNLLGQYLDSDELQVVGVAEPVEERCAIAARRINDHYGHTSATMHGDFRELIERDDVDAVMIGTPDHWHAIPAIMACRTGKHVYCEKPLSLTISEGRAIANAARISGVAFQTGSQQRTEYGRRFVRAVEAIHNGRIGEVKRVTVGVGAPAVPCDLPVEPMEPGTDWVMWNGPAPDRGYSSVLCPRGMHSHYPQWRRYREYANGGLADMGAHHFDIAQWALHRDRSGPVEVLPPEDDSLTGLRFIYDDGVEMVHGGSVDARFEGTDGWIEVSRGFLRASEPAILERPIDSTESRIESASSHIREWIDAITLGTATSADAETGHRTATICQLANIGYELRRPLRWDPVSERFRGEDSDRADRLLARTSNDAWQG